MHYFMCDVLTHDVQAVAIHWLDPIELGSKVLLIRTTPGGGKLVPSGLLPYE